ncbi:MAG: NirD/YgiW/YdeI family stress tolerance protein [Promethearchaeota archaeon]
METQSAIQRMIKDIKNDDTRIQITGKIDRIEEEGRFMLKDSTGEITVDISDKDLDFNEGDLVNVIGNLQITVSGKKILNMDLIQDMNRLNLAYYEEIYEMKKDMLEK